MSARKNERAVLAYSPVAFCVGHLFSKLPCDAWSRFRYKERVMVREEYYYTLVCPALFPVILDF